MLYRLIPVITVFLNFIVLSGCLVAAAPDEMRDFQEAGIDTVPCLTDTIGITNTLGANASSAEYMDGTYIGESPEWTGMKVQVRIQQGRLVKVKVLKAKGTPEYYQDVVRRLPRCIEKQGNVNVDGISGATLSSDSLKEAVLDALRKAVKS